MVTFFKRALVEIRNRQNLDLYINLLVCSILVGLGLVGVVSSNILFAGILATLLLSVVNNLNTRSVVENIGNSIDAIATSKSGGLTSELWDDAKGAKKIESATQVSCMAIAGYTYINANAQHFKRMLRRGGKARFLLVDPFGQAMTMAVARNFGAAKSMDHQVTLVRLSLEKLKEIVDEGNPERLEVKLIDYLPETVMTMIDDQSESGLIYVTFQGFNQPTAIRPSFILESSKDAKLFTFYRSSFDELWNWKASQTIDLPTYIAKMKTELKSLNATG
jgi:hypothetical protein